MQLNDPPLVFRFEPVGRLEQYEPMVLRYVDIVAHSLAEAYFSIRAMGMQPEHVRLMFSKENEEAVHGKVAPHFVLNMDADDRPAIDDMSDGASVVEEHDDGKSVDVPISFLMIDIKGNPMVQHLDTPEAAQAAWDKASGACVMWRGAGIRLIASKGTEPVTRDVPPESEEPS